MWWTVNQKALSFFVENLVLDVCAYPIKTTIPLESSPVARIRGMNLQFNQVCVNELT